MYDHKIVTGIFDHIRTELNFNFRSCRFSFLQYYKKIFNLDFTDFFLIQHPVYCAIFWFIIKYAIKFYKVVAYQTKAHNAIVVRAYLHK